jgi:hypothetical protein
VVLLGGGKEVRCYNLKETDQYKMHLPDVESLREMNFFELEIPNLFVAIENDAEHLSEKEHNCVIMNQYLAF